MQKETTVPESIAWEKFHKIVNNNLVHSGDDRLNVFAELCGEEVVDRAFPDEKLHTFWVSVTTCGHWAAKVLPKVSLQAFPKTRMTLCGYIVEAWLFCRDLEEEKKFADVLRGLDMSEQKKAADVVRRVLEFRYELPLRGDTPVPRLLRFLAGTNIPSLEYTHPNQHTFVNAEEHTGNRAVFRTVAKALGAYLPSTSIVEMASAFLHAEQARQTSRK